MNYDDQFLYRLIKRLYEQMAAIETRVGNISTTINLGGGLIVRDAPMLVETPPPDVTKIWFLTFRNGAPGLIWDNATQAWI